jgi:hypothetical protein
MLVSYAGGSWPSARQHLLPGYLRRVARVLQGAELHDRRHHAVFKLKEVRYSVVDRYTGKTHEVKGLSGVFANRFPGDSPPDDPYCSKNSTAKELVDTGKCKANLSAGTLNLDYVGVSNDKRRCKSNDAKCGKPLVNLNAPARN